MPSLLVTNDDGVHAPGLAALEAALAELGDVYVLAPEREQSACGHALTLHRPLRVDRLGERRFAVNGTPSDCVNLGVLGFLPERPVLVVAGVNPGTNPGGDVTDSGAVAAAWEELQGTDMGALHEGYVSITPLHLDLTDHRAVDALADFGRSLDAQYRPTARKRARSE